MFNFKKYLSVGVGFLLLCFSNPAAAEAPWKWQLSLNMKKDQSGNQLLFPTAVYVDKDRERYYVVDAGSNSLHSFDIKGNHLNTLKPGEQLKQPYAIVRDSHEILWVVEKGNNSLTQIDLKEKKIVTHELKFNNKEVYPDRLVMVDDQFYVLDKYSGRILLYDINLNFLKDFGCSECKGGIRDFTVKDHKIWALGTIDKCIYLFDANGDQKKKVNINKNVTFPFALDIGPGGQIYVLDRHSGSVVVFDDNGEFKYRFLAKGESRGRLYYPEDIKFDPWGRLCVIDSGNGRVELFGR